VTDPDTNKDVPSALATPVWVTVDNMQQVVRRRLRQASDVCTGPVAAACTKAGIS
jgi:D-xylose transport system substrate-binding protein